MLQKITAFFTALAMLASVQMLVPILGEITYIRGALGVRGFYRLYDTQGAWQARRETVIGHTLDVFRIDLAEAKRAPEGRTGYAPKVTAHGVTIDRFYVETIPGYYLCANLYASADPAVNEQPMPLVMLAQGHFPGDRHNSDYQHLAAAFAQRGFLVASWDMVGRGDDKLLTHYDNYNTVIQTWNSIKLLSYLLSERFTAESSYQIDERYVAVTGASGGGTQAVYMSLLDDRLTASIPVVMVSAWSSGYCQCENGVNALRKRNRLGVTTFKTNNAERVAAFAQAPAAHLLRRRLDHAHPIRRVPLPALRLFLLWRGEQSREFPRPARRSRLQLAQAPGGPGLPAAPVGAPAKWRVRRPLHEGYLCPHGL